MRIYLCQNVLGVVPEIIGQLVDLTSARYKNVAEQFFCFLRLNYRQLTFNQVFKK